MKNNYVNKFDKQVSTFGIREQLAVVFGIILAVVIYFMFFYVDKTPYGYAEIPEDLVTYLSGAGNYYAEDYNSGKMLVLYTLKRDKKYKYPKQFQDALDVVMETPELGELYNFHGLQPYRNNILFEGEKGEKILKGEKALRKVCRSFCVVNPKKKALYFYFQPKDRDAQYLQENLEKLEFWGAKLN